MTPGQQCYETYWRTIDPAANEMSKSWNKLDEANKQGWDAIAKMKTAITPADAIACLSAAFKADPGYAWGWHCNIACAAMDQGVAGPVANKLATEFMRRAFGVDTKEPVLKGATDGV